MCPYSVHKTCVLFSEWDLNQKQSASNFTGLRKNMGKGRRHKGHGSKQAALMLPLVEQQGLLQARHSAPELAQHLQSLQTEATPQVIVTSE